jgi:beta-N-acetylhexosaminidase
MGGVCAAAAVVLVFATNADAGPAGRTGESASDRSASDLSTQAGNAAASADSLRTAAAQPAAVQTPESVLASTMTTAQLAGQRVIYSYSGLTPPSSLLKLIRRGEVGGVIFFSSNFQSDSQFTGAVATLDAANSATSNPAHAYPLMLMVDQEGGEVRRLPGAPVDSEEFIGSRRTAARRAALATAAGQGAGENLLSFGLNVNLAPVLDVFRAAGDFDDQFQRSYSMNPHIVSTLGADFITAQQATGVAATAKHFPGLGAATANQDTDEVPVTITLSKHALQTVDELPYEAAIAAGVKLVLVSWAKYPNLGSDRPAGLSSVIVQGQLRRRLGFSGVTITDAIGAGALVPYGSIQNRSLLAAEAGMELILSAAQTPTEGEDAQAGLESGLTSGTLSESGFLTTVTQILTLRSTLPDDPVGPGRA